LLCACAMSQSSIDCEFSSISSRLHCCFFHTTWIFKTSSKQLSAFFEQHPQIFFSSALSSLCFVRLSSPSFPRTVTCSFPSSP
jgi:hypothetical protein